jgi:hypothetical protein
MTNTPAHGACRNSPTIRPALETRHWPTSSSHFLVEGAAIFADWDFAHQASTLHHLMSKYQQVLKPQTLRITERDS